MENNLIQWGKVTRKLFIMLSFTLFSIYSVIGQTNDSIHIVIPQVAVFDPLNSITIPEIEFENGVPIFPWARPVVIL
jgi:hypothetical protein